MSTGIGIGIAGQVYDLKPGVPGGGASYSNLYSMEFISASSSYLEALTTPLLGTSGTGAWTLSLWVNFDAVGLAANQRVMDLGYGGTQRLQMYLNTSDGIAISGPYTDNYNTIPLSAATWYNVIYRYDGNPSGTGNVGFVLSGELIGTNPQNKTRTSPTFAADGDTWFGRNSGGNYLNGFMDEISIWSTYLSNSECEELYNSGTPTDLASSSMSANLQHWWRMGDPAGPSTYPTIPDVGAVGTNTLTMTGMTSVNIQTDVP